MPRLSSITSEILLSKIAVLSSAIDALWQNVVFLLNGETSTTSMSLIDLSPNPNIIDGTATITSAASRYGSKCIQFGGSGSSTYITLSKNIDTRVLWTNNFTFECWFNIGSFTPTGGNGLQGLFCVGDYTNGILFRLSATYGIELYVVGANVNNQVNITTGVWHHIALVRSGSLFIVFYDGVRQPNTYTYSGSIPQNTIIIGRASHNTSAEYFYGYLDDIRLTNGVARYTLAAQTSQLLTSGVWYDNTFVDVGLFLTGNDLLDRSYSPKTLSTYGSPVVSTTIKKYNNSIYFNGSSSLYYANTLTELILDSDFTIEMWLYITDVSSGYHRIFQNQQGSNTGTGFFYVYNNATSIIVYNTTIGTLVAVGTFTASTWFHLALVKYGTTFTVYINGVATYNSFSMNTTVSSVGFVIGGGATEPMTGYISDLRITKNIARYPTGFVPPTAALPLINSPITDVYAPFVTVLLKGNGVNGSSTITDSSPVNRTVTNTGSPINTNSIYRYGGSSISLPASSGIAFPKPTLGGDNFTIECWAYKTGSQGWGGFAGSWPNPGTNATNSWGFGQGGSGTELWMGFFTSSSSYVETQASPGSWPLNTWIHIAIVRLDTTITMYKNGVSILTLSSFTTPVYAGTHPTVNIGAGVGFYIDDFRITLGVARYRGSFAPPGAL